MGKRILTIALWGLVAVFIMKACFPSGDPAPSGGGAAARAETFDTAVPDAYPLVLDNALVRTEWSATGASCGRILLKDYHAELGKDDPLVLYDAHWVDSKAPAAGDEAKEWHYRRREAFRLLDQSSFLFAADENGLRQDLDRVEWQVEQPRPDTLVFTWESPSGVALTKTVKLPDAVYHVDAQITAVPLNREASGRDLTFRLATGGGVRTENDGFYPNPYVGAARLDHGQFDKVEFFLPDGDWRPGRAGENWLGEVPYIVEGSKYFLSAIQPLANADGRHANFKGAVSEILFDDLLLQDQVQAGGTVRISDPRQASFWKRASVAGGFTLKLGDEGVGDTADFRWYIGPKDPRTLIPEIYGTLTEVIDDADYGRSMFYRIFLTPLIAPFILWLLQMFEGLVGNWGIAIIFLTVLVRAAVFPIMRHSQVKMAVYQAKMAKVKPQLEAINKKFAKDSQRKQQETMKLYQQHKLSPPLGGCLPIFLQMPIFVGLFQALRSSILLRHEPLGGWIQDLSRPDALIDFGGPVLGFWPFTGVTTLNLLPITMVVLWIVHQRSMPKSTDPQQQQMMKIMTFMPIIFGFVLYNYAAGLSLYMITSSAIGIFEQKVIKKRWPVPTPGAPDPPASAS